MQQCVVLVKRMPWLWTLSGSVKWTWRGDQMGGVIYGRTSFSSHSTHVTMVGYYDVDYAASSGERNVVAAGAHDGRPRVWTAVHAHSVTVARCTPRLFTWCGRGAPYNKQLTCLVFDDRDQEITYITPTLERQDPIGLDVHIQHVVSSIYSMQQSTVWWTRRGVYVGEHTPFLGTLLWFVLSFYYVYLTFLIHDTTPIVTALIIIQMSTRRHNNTGR